MSVPRGEVRQPGVSAALVGRAEELETLATAVTSPPALAVVEGEAGVGKTRLIAELRARPELESRPVLLGACRRIREPFPLGPLLDAVRGLDERSSAVELSPVAGALRPLLPELGGRLPPLPEPLDDREAERHRVFRGLVELLGSLGPVGLVLEDLHWADEQTVDFLGYLLGDPPPELALVLTFRGEEVDPWLRALTASAPSPVSAAQVALSPLDTRETAQLAAAILGAGRLSEEFVLYLHERTAGVPFAIEEVLALLRARGTLVRERGGGWIRRMLDELDVPSGIREPVLERVGRLSRHAKAVLEAASVLQIPVGAEVLVATRGVSPARARDGLVEALEAGLLVESETGIGFRHLLAAQAVYEAIPGPRREDLHARSAATLQEHAPTLLGQIAHHLRRAGRTLEWVDAADRASDQAIGLGHDAEAVRLLEDVLREAPLTPDRRGWLAVKLGQAAVEAARAGEAVDLVARVLEQDGQELTRDIHGELCFWLAGLLELSGADVERQGEHYRRAVDDLDHKPELQASAMIAAGICAVAGTSLAERMTWVDRALVKLAEVDNPVFEVSVLGKAAMMRAAIGERSWREQTERILTLAGGPPHQRKVVNAYWSVGLAAAYAGHYRAADRLLTAAQSGAAACDSARLDGRIRSATMLLDYCRGDWSGIDDRVDTLFDQLAGDAPSSVDVEVVAACLTLAHGELVEAHRTLDHVIDRLTQTGDFEVLPFVVSAYARLAVARSRDGDARVAVERLTDTLELTEFKPLSVRAVPWVTEALLAAGRVDAAHDLVARYERELHGLDAPLAPAALRHARGFVDENAGRPAEAATHYLSAAALYDDLPDAYDAALAREQAARCLLDGPDAAARRELLEAITAYERLGASWDLDRARSVARAHGIPVAANRGGRRSYGDKLSPRELAVARLAATGLTNKQIADELFLSASTVKHQVSAAMRKLGVHSRALLPDSLDRARG